MENAYDYKKFAVLYVDDEEKSLKLFARAFSDSFRIFTTANATGGLKLIEERGGEIGVLMTDQRMPAEKGTWLLEHARQLHPRIIRILVTAYADMDAAISAVNTGAIYRYVTKPWDPVQLEHTLKRSLEFFIVQRERDQLLREKMAALRNMMVADHIVSLGLLAAGLSHHIRNSLVAVKTFLDLAPTKMFEEKMDVEGLRNPDFWKEYYQNAQTQIEKIIALLKDLWTASEKPESEFADRVSAREAVAAGIEAVGEANFAAKKIEVNNEISESLPLLKANKSKLFRLFELLLKDELAALPSGSRITFSAEPANGAEKAVLIRVTDSGSGLPQEALRMVFDPFFLRSGSPLEYGIHLMACYFIVHHHGGRIEAHSEKDGGTTFKIRLPLDPNLTPPSTENETEFLRRVLFNESRWEKLISNE